jgi:hypothetical protein
MALLLFGFSLMFHALAASFEPPVAGLDDAIYFAGSSLLTLVRLPSLRDSHAFASWIAFAGFVAVFTVAMAACENFLLRPLVRDLPRAPRKAGTIESLRNQSRAMSLTTLAALSALCALASAGSLGTYFMSSEVDLFSMLGAVLAGFSAVLFSQC